jgi:copper chaperone
MSTKTFTVEGMTCGHCVNSVTEEVSELAGITSVEVVLEGGQVTVHSDTDIDDDAVAAAVIAAGYKVVG